MANKKISELPSLTTPASGDQIAVVDISGTPTTKRVTANNLMTLAPVQSVAGRTGTVTLSDTDISGLGTAATTASTDYATAAQGTLADSATQPGDNISTLTNDSNFIDSSGAPVQSVAGRTGTVTLSNTDVSGLGTAATLDVGTSANNIVQLNGSAQLPAVDGSNLTGISSAVSSGTAASLPSSPSVGNIYLETDTGKLRWWDGTYWNTFNYDSQYDPNYAANQLGYSGGLFNGTNYNISTQPKMHFDAAILDGSDQANNPSSGSAVSTWGDRSGQAVNYDATQATGSAQPTFNVSGNDKYLSFDGGDSLDFTDYALPTTFNMVVVCNTGADVHTLLPVGTNTNSQYILLEYNGKTYGISGSIVDNTYGPNYNSIQQFWSTRDGSNNQNIYVQGANSIISTTTSLPRTLARIGKANDTIFHTGDIYEIIIWGADLSTTDKNTVNSYLANKYSSLPTLTSFS